MQASKTATEGSKAIALPEVLGILSERLHRLPLSVHLCLQCQHVLQLRPAVLSHISERKLADVHPMHDQRTGDTQDVRGIVWTKFPILGKERDPLPWTR